MIFRYSSAVELFNSLAVISISQVLFSMEVNDREELAASAGTNRVESSSRIIPLGNWILNEPVKVASLGMERLSATVPLPLEAADSGSSTATDSSIVPKSFQTSAAAYSAWVPVGDVQGCGGSIYSVKYFGVTDKGVVQLTVTSVKLLQLENA